MNTRTATPEMQRLFAEALICRARGDLSGYFAGVRKVHKLNADAVAHGWYDPMIVEWPLVFSPIEYEMWIYLRERDLPMFPQYPIGRFFADFADPWAKVVVECDGKDYHGIVRDSERDALMSADGWNVHRISGSAIWMEKPQRYERWMERDELLDSLQYECRGFVRRNDAAE